MNMNTVVEHQHIYTYTNHNGRVTVYFCQIPVHVFYCLIVVLFTETSWAAEPEQQRLYKRRLPLSDGEK